MTDVTEQCRHCLAYGEQRRLMVRDTSAAELPAVQCEYCEAVCLVTPLASSAERVIALEAKCDLLSASLKQADAERAALALLLQDAQQVARVLAKAIDRLNPFLNESELAAFKAATCYPKGKL